MTRTCLRSYDPSCCRSAGGDAAGRALLRRGLGSELLRLCAHRDYRGFADWFDDAERRRREISRGGFVWRPDHIGPPWRLGIVVLLLGLLFLIGGVTAT
jgi:hypothetical protein